MNDDLTAVALNYDGAKAPTVLATGQSSLAEEILAIAREHEIPIYENPDLVALLCSLSVGDEIPPDLYHIIAEIIAFAFYIKGTLPPGFHPEGVSEHRHYDI
ncbi:MAG: EscU/YscU/HrcU family type III secretion system export apparatus switch protein [Natronospirillum sp.]